MIRDDLFINNAPAIPGLRFRFFAGPSDYPAIVDAINAGHLVDHIEEIYTLEGLTSDWAHLNNCDLSTDLLIPEVDGRVVGFGRVFWWVNDVGERIYGFNAEVHPEWRGKGIGRAMLQWQEQRAYEIAAGHSPVEPRYLQTFVMETAQRRMALLKHAGYTPIRYGYMMVRPNLAEVAASPEEWPLPEGLEVRPVLPEHWRPIWEATNEAFRDHWGHRPSTEEDYQGFLTWPDAQPHLWQVAWDARTNEVAGMVMNSIFKHDNERLGILRGWTDPICVRRPWRRQGLARALIMRSLKALRCERRCNEH
jgi:mycothiol synthase